MAPNQYSTHNNPYYQGGWEGEAGWNFPPGTPSDGAHSPVPSTHSSGSSRSSASGGGWTPAQSSFGVLPVSAAPGAPPVGTPGTIVFRFMARGNQSELCLMGPGNRPEYMIRTGTQHTVISSPSGQIAAISWPTGAQGTSLEPILERFGRRLRLSEFLRDLPGTRLKVMNVEGVTYSWSTDQRGMYIHPDTNTASIIGVVDNNHGIEIKLNQNTLTQELLANVVIAVVMLQGRTFVGVR